MDPLLGAVITTTTAAVDSSDKDASLLPIALVCVVALLLLALTAFAVSAFIGAFDAEGHPGRSGTHKRSLSAVPGLDMIPPLCAAPAIKTTCAVCLESLLAGQACRTLRCTHVFHAGCIMEWWTHQAREGVPLGEACCCPLCRRRQKETDSHDLEAVHSAGDRGSIEGDVGTEPGAVAAVDVPTVIGAALPAACSPERLSLAGSTAKASAEVAA